MEYKYKEEIIKAIPNTQLEVYSDLSDELNEVYIKAEAFDEIAQIYDENTGLGEQDEDSTNFETLVGEVGSVINSVESGDSE